MVDKTCLLNLLSKLVPQIIEDNQIITNPNIEDLIEHFNDAADSYINNSKKKIDVSSSAEELSTCLENELLQQLDEDIIGIIEYFITAIIITLVVVVLFIYIAKDKTSDITTKIIFLIILTFVYLLSLLFASSISNRGKVDNNCDKILTTSASILEDQVKRDINSFLCGYA